MPLLEVLLVLVLVDQDEVDLPHAVVEEEGVRIVVELHLRRETGLARQLGRHILVRLLLHNVVHDATEGGGGGGEDRLTARLRRADLQRAI